LCEEADRSRTAVLAAFVNSNDISGDVTMKIIRNLLTGLMLVGLSLLALPASAAKIYTMAVQSTGTNTVAVTIHNVTPENNSVINSFVINKPYTDASLTFSGSSDPLTTTAFDANGNLKVTGFNGLKSANKNPNTITINLTVNWGSHPTPACGSTVPWTSIAYTGTFSSTTFQLVDGNGNNIGSVPMSFNCYTLTGLPGLSTPIPAGTSNKHYSATLTNTSAAGGPSITSFTVSGSTVTASAASFTPALPLAPGASTTVDVTVTTACGASGANWSSSAGATFTGTTSAASYGVSPCSVSFAQGPPPNVGNGAAITPTIKLAALNGESAVLPWDGSVSWTALGSGGTVGGTGGAACVDTGICSIWGFASLAVTGTPGNSYQLKASTSVGTATSSSFTIWDGLLACGNSFNASASGATHEGDPGYALITYTGLKTGGCTGPVGINAVNTLLTDNKLVVLVSDEQAAFTATISSTDLAVVDGYASQRVKVAWLKDGNGNWLYYPARTCSCSSALTSCMPTGAVSTDPYDGTAGNEVRVCAVDYFWTVGSTAGFARYTATISGTGNDPAMGWGAD